MKKNYFYVHPCPNCIFRYDCYRSPLNRNSNNSGVNFVFFPELLTEISFAVLFPELSFYVR
ncbi:hypothetical protein SDC9_15081 [bioreactor metagenome]|uniref:Uncharacterized protein n=1 Tax=bioreactor metagenome TaxID=1076179 RepID=A0A644TSW0_9ZZZZ